MFKKIFKNKKVIVTGHTGFKGSWLSIWLKSLGAQVLGISVDIPTNPSLFKQTNILSGINDKRFNLSNIKTLNKTIKNYKPDYLFHLAAQSLVSKSFKDPITTWHTNVIGTLNVLNSLRNINHRCIAIIITSDKCYKNIEIKRGYKENDELGGFDPYSASKGAAEIVFKSYFKSYFSKKNCKVRIATARAGNVIGGGDWAPDRLIPDCIRAWSKSKIVNLRNPKSTRPWQHVLEPLSGYMWLAKSLRENISLSGQSFNFGPQTKKNYSVKEVAKLMSKKWKNVRWKIHRNKKNNFYESNLLRLNCNKANKLLKWKSTLDFKKTVDFTSEWYRLYYQDPKKILKITNKQIEVYAKIAKNKKLAWVK